MKIDDIINENGDGPITIKVDMPYIPYINEDDVWEYADQQELETIMEISLQQNKDQNISSVFIEFQNDPHEMDERQPDRLKFLYKHDMLEYFRSQEFIRNKFAGNTLLANKWIRYVESL